MPPYHRSTPHRLNPRRLLPRLPEVAALAVLSLIFAAITFTSGSVGAFLAVLAMPLFILCALLGMHRAGRLARQPLRIDPTPPASPRSSSETPRPR